VLVKSPIVQRHLGWALKSEWVSGLVKANPKNKQVVLTAQQTMIKGATKSKIRTATSWVNGVSVTAVSSDVCHFDLWGVFWLKDVSVWFTALCGI
jgi:hypothetical protein